MLGDVYTVKYLETFCRELDEAADYDIRGIDIFAPVRGLAER